MTSGIDGAGIDKVLRGDFLPFITPEAFALYQDFDRALYSAL